MSAIRSSATVRNLLCGLFHQAALDDFVDALGELRMPVVDRRNDRSRLVLRMLVAEHLDRAAVERKRAGDHLEEHDAETRRYRRERQPTWGHGTARAPCKLPYPAGRQCGSIAGRKSRRARRTRSSPCRRCSAFAACRFVRGLVATRMGRKIEARRSWPQPAAARRSSPPARTAVNRRISGLRAVPGLDRRDREHPGIPCLWGRSR